MPIFVFCCDKCETEREHILRVSEAKPTHCDECGEPVRQVYFPATPVFRGRGFHSTDYPKK